MVSWPTVHKFKWNASDRKHDRTGTGSSMQLGYLTERANKRAPPSIMFLVRFYLRSPSRCSEGFPPMSFRPNGALTWFRCSLCLKMAPSSQGKPRRPVYFSSAFDFLNLVLKKKQLYRPADVSGMFIGPRAAQKLTPLGFELPFLICPDDHLPLPLQFESPYVPKDPNPADLLCFLGPLFSMLPFPI